LYRCAFHPLLLRERASTACQVRLGRLRLSPSCPFRLLLIQPFINYNMEDGWYLVSSPIIAANWEAASNKWAFPIGAGIGKIFKIGEQPLNFNLQAYDYVKSPVGGPRWAVRAQLQLLFPK